ncbi:pilus assembly protein [Sphingopyxis sp. BSN-002]|uniref:TadE/TadG family type IV pilus assembly protein n=1 Tax=Sphingopyxis sp. BSN-002 TaxID=2911495 RepID=UPI001EDB97F0|nr:TadE/TadG family type IV pilus assembly protein [Sphingopyxis sp. BSN-002]UKK86208.1 pilus assembly protein [Sphingopyxis sp. BSN-002]
MIRRFVFARRLARNQRGTAFMEFALAAPLFLLLTMGGIDYCWQLYGQQVLQGAVNIAGRSGTTEAYVNNTAALDIVVRNKVHTVFKDAQVNFSRRAYETFSEVGKPEAFTDKNNNGRYDSGECFEDVNGNGAWDADRGSSSSGSSDDVVVYVATMKYNRILPVWRMLGQPQEKTLVATTVLRNQPYATNTATSKVICS